MQNMENNENDVVEIDLLEVLVVLLSRAWLIILCALAAGAAAYAFSRFVLTEQYESTTRIYILNRQNDNALTYSDVQLGTQLTKDFTEIVKSRYVLDKVIATCGLTESSGALASRISVVTKSDTRIIAITVTDPDPARAQYVADEVRKEAADRIKSVMDIEAVNVVDEANLPTSPSAPVKSKWALIGAFAGAFLCAAAVLVRFMMDDTVKTSEDVERYLGLSTLGMIPSRDVEEKKNKKKNKKKSSANPSQKREPRREIYYDAGHAPTPRRRPEAVEVEDIAEGTVGHSDNGDGNEDNEEGFHNAED